MNHFRRQLSIIALPFALLAIALSPLAARAGAPAASPESAEPGLAERSSPSQNFHNNWAGSRPQHPFRVKVGLAFPVDKDIHRALKSIPDISLDYDFLENNFLGGPTVFSGYANWAKGGRFGRKNSAQYDFKRYELGVTVRRLFGGTLNTRHFYFGASLGIGRIDYSIDPTGPNNFSKENYGLASGIFAGYQLNPRFFTELGLKTAQTFKLRDANAQRVTIDPSTAQLSFGYRF